MLDVGGKDSAFETFVTFSKGVIERISVCAMKVRLPAKLVTFGMRGWKADKVIASMKGVEPLCDYFRDPHHIIRPVREAVRR